MRYFNSKSLFTAAILLSPISIVAIANPAPLKLLQSQKVEIIEIIRPSLDAASKLTATMAPAKNIGELQSQITELLTNKEIETLYKKANDKLNQLAKTNDLAGPYGIPNFDEVTPGVYRSATPTLSQVESLFESKKVDYVISLNPELKMLAKMDPGTTAPLTAERRKVMLEKLAARGKSEDKADSLLKLYEDHLSYAQAVFNRSSKNIESFSLDGPEETIAEYFAVLNRILELRKQNKNVLFHCNIGKHRTGLMAMLIEVLDNQSPSEQGNSTELYLKFIERNWNKEAQTRIHYMIVFPLISQSAPFTQLALQWQSTKKPNG